ncbi:MULTISPECIES: hypothetical protein [Metallibacterium]|nr:MULTISPECIES: hypothetical protein [Metallibacterium]
MVHELFADRCVAEDVTPAEMQRRYAELMQSGVPSAAQAPPNPE